ncbi:MAG: DUF4166 domain-containing protein [Proteobacteria bacterium]|nr:DUF4166 domain-containing protein [Pseudomonadota bacterium]
MSQVLGERIEVLSAAGQKVSYRKFATFRALVGERGWARLTRDIRSRFASKAQTKVVHYAGSMEEVTCSTPGWILAQAARVVGTPLAPHRGRDVPMDVKVFEDKKTGGTVWERVYYFKNRRPLTVRSTKHFTGKSFLVECVGGGIGMKLDVFEEDHKLHFRSTRYFWQIGGVRLPLPHFMTPGIAHVTHTDEGGGLFRFTMTIDHQLFGRMFYQDGVFQEEAK